uniref:Uncharacterized protein n=1 Tax=Salix viminalis TaxID=40686 RepID=A0A6N2MAC2_SALVM
MTIAILAFQLPPVLEIKHLFGRAARLPNSIPNKGLVPLVCLAIVSVFPDPTGASSQNTLADNRSSQSTIEAKPIFPRTKQPSSRSENSLRSPIKLRVSSLLGCFDFVVIVAAAVAENHLVWVSSVGSGRDGVEESEKEGSRRQPIRAMLEGGDWIFFFSLFSYGRKDIQGSRK